MDKNSIVLYDNWLTIIAGASDEVALQICRAMACWKLGKEYRINDPTAQAIFESMLPKLEDDRAAYEEKCKTNKRIADEREQRKRERCTNAHERLTNVNLTDTDTETDINIKNARAREEDPLPNHLPPETNPGVDDASIADGFADKELGSIFVNWLHNRCAMRDNFPYGSIVEAIRQAQAAEIHFGADKCKELIKASLARGWKGIPWENLEKKPQSARSGTSKPKWGSSNQRDYDFDAIEKTLLAQ